MAGRVVVRVPVLGLPIGPYEATGLFEIRCLIQMLFSALDFSFHSATSLGPLAQVSLRFFVPSFVSKLFVLIVEPGLLELLLGQLVCRIVRKVAGSSLEVVLGLKLDSSLIIGIERLKSRLKGGALSLTKVGGVLI